MAVVQIEARCPICNMSLVRQVDKVFVCEKCGKGLLLVNQQLQYVQIPMEVVTSLNIGELNEGR